MELTEIEKKKIQKVISDIYNKFDNPRKKKNSRILFNVESSFLIVEKIIKILNKEPSILQMSVNLNENNFVVVGDIHGDLRSLISIFKKEGNPSRTKYLFLGDYIDRGENSCEVISLLYAYKILYPSNIYLIRGNHEFIEMNDFYGFKDECERRDVFGPMFYKKIVMTYRYLPLCAVLNDKIFCVHGGISSLIEKREDLNKVRKVGNALTIFDRSQTEFLWNDPDENVLTFCNSPRGSGNIFGKLAVDDFLKKMNFELIIRAHQNEMKGFNWPFGQDGGILTLFSAIDYCETGNDGAYAKITNNGNVKCSKILLSNEVSYINNDTNFEIKSKSPFIEEMSSLDKSIVILAD